MFISLPTEFVKVLPTGCSKFFERLKFLFFSNAQVPTDFRVKRNKYTDAHERDVLREFLDERAD